MSNQRDFEHKRILQQYKRSVGHTLKKLDLDLNTTFLNKGLLKKEIDNMDRACVNLQISIDNAREIICKIKNNNENSHVEFENISESYRGKNL